MNPAINNMRNNGPKKIWPWIVGGAVALGGVKIIKDRKVAVQHKPGTQFTKPKTNVNVTKKD